jgi:hypothetical protein
MRAALLLLFVLAGAVPARAQTVVTSAGPDKVSVTLYRDPNRDTQSAINRSYPQGFALVTETRTVTIPAGPAVIRFEGVAGNILPESALVSGLPDGVEEKNLDANLLSPRSLFDRALGRRVLVRRTNPATGKAQLLQATLRSSADGAAVLQFGGAYGDLRCSGLPETIVYDGVPEGLSAKPTLSVKTTAKAERQVTLTLSYLSGGFDWQADYVIAMRKDGQSADLFAWITLASTDVTSFVDADTQVVAGKINRSTNSNFGPRNFASASYLPLQCWPLPEYDLYESERFARAEPGAPPPPPPPPPAPVSMDVVVTASRAGFMADAKVATVEALGDLKLYRFPTRVTVASQSQKQVGLMNKPGVKLAPIYVSDIMRENAQTGLLLRGKNNAVNGLGAAMPAGKAAVFSDVDGQMLLVGESAIDDKAVDELVEFRMGRPQSVSAQVVGARRRPNDRTTAYALTVTNDQPWQVTYEAKIHLYDYEKIARSSSRLGRKDGASFWTIVIPANGTATLSYAVRDDRKRVK